MKIIRETLINKTTVRVIQGDLTEATVYAIVNAANSHLQHGGGVAGVIARKGGAIIQEESNRIGFVPVGQCAVTSAGKLPARYVIHAVGPRWGEGEEEAKLHSAVASALRMASDKEFSTIAMPAISAGIFGFPKDQCARIMMEEIASFSRKETAVVGVDIYLIDPEIIVFFSTEMDKFGKAP